MLAAGALFWPGSALAAPTAALIIAEGGTSAELPADTEGAFERAIAEGADFLEVGLVASQDGALAARRDNALSATTDVASHPEFASRRTTKTLDGAPSQDWFTEDFTLAELKTLTCLSRSRPGPAKADEPRPAILTFQEVIALARAGSVRTARVIGVDATLGRAAHFAAIGLPLETRVADAVRAEGYDSAAAAMIVGSGEEAALASFGTLSRVRRARIIASVATEETASPQALAAIRASAEIVSLEADLLLGDPSLIARAHGAGLAVHARIPPAGIGGRRQFDGLVDLMARGVDGVVTDAPAAAARARGEALRVLQRRRSSDRGQAASPN